MRHTLVTSRRSQGVLVDRSPSLTRRAGRRLGVPLALTAAVVAGQASTAAAGSYEVRSGDTLSGIAKRHGTTSGELARLNSIEDRNEIRAGQVIAVPSDPEPAPAAAATYRVRDGDTVSAIARRTGSTAAAIVAANGLDERALIRAGQELVLPGVGAPEPAADTSGEAQGDEAAPASSPATTSAEHTVVAGETVEAIARRYGVPQKGIIEANDLNGRALIRIGQVLRVPGIAVQVSVPTTFEGRTYAPAVTAAATANKATLASRDLPTREEMRQIIAGACRDQGADPALALAISYQESGHNMGVVSPANAIGAMQVIPSSGRWASDLVGRNLDLLDPQDNATAGCAILASLLRSTGGDEAAALAGYYQGLASVSRNGMYDDTRRYVANVQTLKGRFG